MPVISSIEVIPLKVPLGRLFRGSYYQMKNRCTIITRVRTDDGLIGEAYNGDTDEDQDRVLSIIREEIAPRIMGQEILSVERCWHSMVPVTLDQLRDRAIPMQAIACVDTAIWDAFGKACGVPLWQLWGGFRDRIPVIGIGGYYGSSEADLEEEIGFFKERGMVGMKFKIGGMAPEEDARRLKFAKKVAPDFIFMVDANQGYTVSEALNFVDRVRDHVQLRWFEEPTKWYDDWRGLRDIRLRANVNVAAGQSEISRVGIREMLINSAVDVCNFDTSWGGGPSEWRRVASLALSFGVELGHHEEAQIAAHELASVPNGTFAETFSEARDPIFWNLIANRTALEDGCLVLPKDPGLGWQLDREFIERYRVDR
jgi:L-alanine-DL-glutamate epimerase-like enolase superfamily enzyme